MGRDSKSAEPPGDEDEMYAERVIRRLAPEPNRVEAEGVEKQIRLEHGTRDHPPGETFEAEIRLAQQCERTEPGYLKRC